jgi:GH24 family phage-related lysozyme (muramidase)
MEISNNGEVDIWGFQDVSVRSNHNINVLADQDVNIEAGRNINMKASKNWTAGGGQVQEDQGDGGDINLEARNDMNYKVVRDWNTDLGRDWLNLAGRDWKTTAGAQIHQKSGAESFHTSGGGFETNAGGDYVESAPNIHMNSFPAAQADSTEEVEKIPQQNLKDKDAYNAEPFNWQDNRRKTIVQRIPQHEPYLAHDIRTTGLRGKVQEANIEGFEREVEDSGLAEQVAVNRATHTPGSSPDTIETPQGRKVKTATTNQGEPVYQTTPGDGEFRPAASYDISNQGLEFIAKHEGFVPEIYSDVGNPAIGYGHNLTPQELEQGYIEAEGEKIFYENGITEEQARKILRKDAQIAANAVRQNTDVELTQAQFDSLTSFTFNVGAGAYNSSTLRRKLNQGKYESVPGEMARWNKAGGRINSGLVKRRDDEAELFTSST